MAAIQQSEFLKELLKMARGYHRRHLCWRRPKVLVCVCRAVGQECRGAGAQNGSLTFDLNGDLAIQNIEPPSARVGKRSSTRLRLT